MKKFVLFILFGFFLSVLSMSFMCSDSKKIKIGISFAELQMERWSKEKNKMIELAKKAGASEIFFEVADGDANLQNSQISSMVKKGANAIIIVAQDGTACTIAVEEAAKAGVKCIAYDRLIPTDKLAAYISFDNVEVGKQQALGILDIVKKGNFVLLGGSPTDNNATLVRKGQMDVLLPHITNKEIKIVGDKFVDGWSQEKAMAITKGMLAANKNKVDAIIASNDTTGLGALEALYIKGLGGKVPVSGQDASAAACKAIVEGKFTLTVFKDINLLTPVAVDLAMKLAKGEQVNLQKRFLSELSGDNMKTGEVPCQFLEVKKVTKDNVYDVVVKSGFQPYDEIYSGIPEKDKPPRLY